MDHNLKPVIDEPSVSSLTSSLVQLEINPHCTGGPMNLLPSEMMQLILAKLRLDSNVKKLIRLRLVSTRWRSMVEDYCQMKKSLVVILKTPLFNESVDIDVLIRDLFGFELTKDYACLLLAPELPSESLKSLLNIFPNVVDLYTRILFERTRVSDFVVYINSLDSLKQLDLDGKFFPTLSSLSGALSKLEYISFGLPYNLIYEYFESTLKDYDHHQLISYLGSNCVRVKFNQNTRFVCEQILLWHNLNPLWLANLTHLQLICTDCSSELKFVQVVQFLSEHAPLKVFSFETGSLQNFLHLTPTVILNLGKLTNLAELQLKVEVDFFELNQHSVPLTSLSTVVSTKLEVYFNDQRWFSGDLCTRHLSAILPDLVDLELSVVFRYGAEMSQHEIEQHLDRFLKLRKHKIKIRNW